MAGTAATEKPQVESSERPEETGQPEATPAFSAPAAEARLESPVIDQVCSMSHRELFAALRDGRLGRRELMIWAARFPDEVPLINGELPWIACNLADLD